MDTLCNTKWHTIMYWNLLRIQKCKSCVHHHLSQKNLPDSQCYIFLFRVINWGMHLAKMFAMWYIIIYYFFLAIRHIALKKNPLRLVYLSPSFVNCYKEKLLFSVLIVETICYPKQNGYWIRFYIAYKMKNSFRQ